MSESELNTQHSTRETRTHSTGMWSKVEHDVDATQALLTSQVATVYLIAIGVIAYAPEVRQIGGSSAERMLILLTPILALHYHKLISLRDDVLVWMFPISMLLGAIAYGVVIFKVFYSHTRGLHEDAGGLIFIAFYTATFLVFLCFTSSIRAALFYLRKRSS